LIFAVVKNVLIARSSSKPSIHKIWQRNKIQENIVRHTSVKRCYSMMHTMLLSLLLIFLIIFEFLSLFFFSLLLLLLLLFFLLLGFNDDYIFERERVISAILIFCRFCAMIIKRKKGYDMVYGTLWRTFIWLFIAVDKRNIWSIFYALLI